LRKRIEFWGKIKLNILKEFKKNWQIYLHWHLGKECVIYTDASDTGIGGVLEKMELPFFITQGYYLTQS